MNIETAQRLHQLMRMTAPPSETAHAVIELHAPEPSWPWDAFQWCAGCSSALEQDTVDWPCRTIKVINQYAHIDEIGYPDA